MSCVCGLHDDQTCSRQPCKRNSASPFPIPGVPLTPHAAPIQGWQCRFDTDNLPRSYEEWQILSAQVNVVELKSAS